MWFEANFFKRTSIFINSCVEYYIHMFYNNPDVICAKFVPCPNCGGEMSSLRGAMAEKCTSCGFKDSCCF